MPKKHHVTYATDGTMWFDEEPRAGDLVLYNDRYLEITNCYLQLATLWLLDDSEPRPWLFQFTYAVSEFRYPDVSEI